MNAERLRFGPFVVHPSSFIVTLYRPPVRTRLKPQVILLGIISLLNDSASEMIYPLLPLNALHLPMRTIFYIAVIPGAIGVVLLLFLLREEERAPRRHEATITAPTPLPSRFWRAIGAISLFSLANSSDVFLILQAH